MVLTGVSTKSVKFINSSMNLKNMQAMDWRLEVWLQRNKWGAPAWNFLSDNKLQRQYVIKVYAWHMLECLCVECLLSDVGYVCLLLTSVSCKNRNCVLLAW